MLIPFKIMNKTKLIFFWKFNFNFSTNKKIRLYFYKNLIKIKGFWIVRRIKNTRWKQLIK